MKKTYFVIKYCIDISLILVASLLEGDLKSLLTPSKSNSTPSQWHVCFGCRRCITFRVQCNIQQLSYFDHIKFQHCECSGYCVLLKSPCISTQISDFQYIATVLHFTAVTLLTGYKHTDSIHMFLFGTIYRLI